MGKAQEIYLTLPVEQSARYQVVKEAVLKSYELVPEAYGRNLEIAPKRKSRLMLSLPVKRNGSLISGVHHRRYEESMPDYMNYF